MRYRRDSIDLSATNSTRLDRKKDTLPNLDVVIWPESVDLAEDCRLTSISNHDSCQGVLWFDLMYVDERISVLFSMHGRI